MDLKKYKLGEILEVKRGASLSGEFYATEGKLVETLTIGITALRRINPKTIFFISESSSLSF